MFFEAVIAVDFCKVLHQSLHHLVIYRGKQENLDDSSAPNGQEKTEMTILL